MKYGLRIEDEQILKYIAFPEDQVGLSIYCPGFSIRLIDIKIVTLCPRIPFDDERLFILFVDNNQRIYAFPDLVLESNEIKIIETFFGIGSIREAEWGKFEYSDHNKFNSKIIFPKELYGQAFFERPLKNLDTIFAGIKNVLVSNNQITGLLTEEVKRFLQLQNDRSNH